LVLSKLMITEKLFLSAVLLMINGTNSKRKENDEAELTELLDNIKARVDRIDNIKVRTITATSRERKDALKYGLSWENTAYTLKRRS